jgi:type I restriction enzyme S subunit
MVPNFLQSAIEQGWDVTRLNDLIKSKAILGHLDGNHGNLYPRNSEFVDSGIKYISANALIDGSVDLSKSKYLTAERGSQFKKGVAKDGDVLFAHNATVGPVALLNTKDEYVILSTSLTYYRCNLTKVDNHYLVQYMSSPAFTRQYERIMKQTTRNQLPITAQRDFYFVLPPLPEQRKIAKILSSWDKAISTTERLIDNSKHQKKALMQQLLTGKKRLFDDSGKPFEGEWEEIKLESIVVRTQLGTTERTKENNDSNIVPLIKMGNLTWGGFSFSKLETVPKSIVDESLILQYGDFLFNTRNTPELVGKSAVWKGQLTEATFDNNINRITFNNALNTDFICFYLNHGKGKATVNSLPAGSTSVAAIYWKDLKNIKVPLPNIEEQTKIVSVLVNADQEIELLEQQLADLKQEKKALMQQLLTGKKRVII